MCDPRTTPCISVSVSFVSIVAQLLQAKAASAHCKLGEPLSTAERKANTRKRVHLKLKLSCCRLLALFIPFAGSWNSALLHNPFLPCKLKFWRVIFLRTPVLGVTVLRNCDLDDFTI